MTRIDKTFTALAGRSALITFITAGDPSLEHTVPAMHALVAGGADLLELGIPFSDPEAEGPAIQQSSERALANGVRLTDVLAMVSEFRQQDSHTPVILMGYLNSVLSMQDFASRAQQAGVDGLIMVNLPPEAAAALGAELAACQIDLIFLVAPTTTTARAQQILRQASGFVYYVSLKGITGAGHLQASEVGPRVQALQEMTRLPVCVGFGIKDAKSAAAIAAIADGVVVGSALVGLMAEHAHSVASCSEALQDAAAALKGALDQSLR